MDKLQKAILYILGLGVPIFFLPGVFADAFGLPKFLFLLLGVVALLLIWGYQIYENNAIHWRSAPFDLAVFAFGLAFAVSTFIASPSKIAALTSPNGSGVVILLALLYFLIIQTAKTNAQPNKQTGATLVGLTHAAILISIWAVVNLAMELTDLRFTIYDLRFPAALSPAGSLLTQAAFLLILLFYSAYKSYASYKSYKSDKTYNDIYGAVISAVLLIGLFATAYKLAGMDIFPLLPYRFGWAIAVESFKNVPIFGVGPANFISAFTRFKPININQTDYWNATFGLSSDYYLHILTTSGLLGLASYLFLVQKIVRAALADGGSGRRMPAAAESRALFAIFALQLFVPFNLTLLFTEFILLASLGAASAGPAASIKLVAVREGFVRMEENSEIVEERWKEVEIDKE